MLVDSRRLKLPFTSASGFPHGVCPCRHKISPKIESTTFQCFPIFNRFARILTTILTANPMARIIQKRPRRPNTSDLLAEQRQHFLSVSISELAITGRVEMQMIGSARATARRNDV